MKRFRILLLTLAITGLVMPFFTGCKKGDGDPVLSIYSRKQRLCKEWKVSFILETVSYKKTVITTTFDGNRKTVETYVFDTMYVDGADTFYTYRNTVEYTGSLLFNFEKNGKYQIDEAFTNDETNVRYTSQETGYWYFTGGGNSSGTKYKELLALQAEQYVYNPLNPDTYTFTYTGQNDMYVYHIYQLASKDIELRYHVEETTNLFNIKTDRQMKLEPR